ncbi:hypothetical protein FHS27_005011 [Rhodopirellula rubra]|uniref:Uncharacterized protein n=1 Tax=Aporhodopirellula rubra TaxID=980271 RepID=A0A7W5E408_9BACT|nr:hypothetical protein [Aporhodopirellula rubra]MBB3209173.1 hypothetical protein [Aporhodopirellula rubra]
MLTKVKSSTPSPQSRRLQIATCLADAIINLRALSRVSRSIPESSSESAERSVDSSANPWLSVTTPNVSAEETREPKSPK